MNIIGPGDKVKLARIVSIIMLLLQHKKITAARLAEMLEVNVRTIYRDVEVINLAGIPIITTPGVNGGIGIMDEYKVEKGLFTTADIISLLFGLGSLPLTGEEIATTIAKIKGLVPREQMMKVEMKTRQIVVDHTRWHGRRPFQGDFNDLKAALEGHKLVSFRYYDGHGRESRRRTEPYQLMLKDSNWYLSAYCLTRGDYRVFRLSRMSEVKVLKEVFQPRDFCYEASDTSEMPYMTIKLLVDKSLRGLIADYCGRENLKPRADNKIMVDFPFIESDYGYGLLLSFGDKCECLEPPKIRREVAKRASDLLSLYQTVHSEI